MNNTYYAIVPSNASDVRHYGVKGMRWGKHSVKDAYRLQLQGSKKYGRRFFRVNTPDGGTAFAYRSGNLGPSGVKHKSIKAAANRSAYGEAAASFGRGAKAAVTQGPKHRKSWTSGNLGGRADRAAFVTRSGLDNAYHEKDIPQINRERRRERVTNPKMYVEKTVNKSPRGTIDERVQRTVDNWIRPKRSYKTKGSNRPVSSSAGRGAKGGVKARSKFRTRQHYAVITRQ